MRGLRGAAALPAAALLLAAAAGVHPQAPGKVWDTMRTTGKPVGASGLAIPEIDRRIPDRTETATFALG